MKKITPQYVTIFNYPDWGAYYAPSHKSSEENTGLRIVLFGSTLGGMWVLESLKQLKAVLGNKISLVGLATDDARDKHARISIKKRIWHYFEPAQQHKMVEQIIEEGLSAGMEVFTGNIKTSFFDQLLHQWKPDLIIMACFGQIVPPHIFKYPKMGMYNFHPSDLKNNIGAGPKPFEETMASNMAITCVSIIGVTEIIDHGPLIGQSPEIRITGSDHNFFENVLLAEEKITSVFPHMAWVLVKKILSQADSFVKENFLINFNTAIAQEVKERLLQPIAGQHSFFYPFPDLTLFRMQPKKSEH